MSGKIHLGNAGSATIECGVAARLNWTFLPERVTCKRCLAIYRRRVDGAAPEPSRKGAK